LQLQFNCFYIRTGDVSDDAISIRTTGLAKSYGATRALVGLDLTVATGEIVCLLGANGAGKTTTLQLILGFTPPSAGSAWIGGIEVTRDPEGARARAGYLPEVVELYPQLSGLETLRYFEELAGRRSDAAAARATLTAVGLPADAFERRVATYSKGMRQKLGLAVAMTKGAGALLLDEPMSGLDPVAANQLVQLLRQLAGAGAAILVVTHDIFRAQQVADRIGIMRRGELVDELSAAAMTAPEIERLYVSHLRDLA
jgi:ABC-2 type transport system ATP-binding protein